MTNRHASVADEPLEPRFPRNRLLERVTVGLGALVGLGAVVPGLGFAVLPALLGRRQRPVDIGPVSAFPEGQFMLTTFISDPQQGEISRRTAYVRNNGPVQGEPSFTIMSSRCTHVGCPTQPGALLLAEKARSVPTGDGQLAHLVPLEGLTGFGCPCHGSQFDTEGNRTAGPAPRPLDRYEFSIVDDRLRLDRLVSVSRVVGTGATARFRAFASRSAGEPTQGNERWLYPLQPRR
jgi:Rieske Fe-S protein